MIFQPTQREKPLASGGGMHFTCLLLHEWSQRSEQTSKGCVKRALLQSSHTIVAFSAIEYLYSVVYSYSHHSQRCTTTCWSKQKEPESHTRLLLIQPASHKYNYSHSYLDYAKDCQEKCDECTQKYDAELGMGDAWWATSQEHCCEIVSGCGISEDIL